MFCKNCGNAIEDGTPFCPKCGQAQQEAAVAVQSGNVSPMAAKQQEREWLIDKIEGSFEVMTAMKRAEGELEDLETLLPDYEKKAGNGKRNFYIVLGLLFSPAIIPLLLIPFGIMLQKGNKKKLAEHQQKIQAKQGEIDILKNDAALSWLPYDYRDSTYFAMLYGYIRNMRANTLSEAINLLETEMHQARVELMSSVAAQASMDASSSARAAAGSAAASAFFSLFK